VKVIRQYALSSKALAVAVDREDGWCAYCDAVAGMNHDLERFDVMLNGSKLPEHIATAMFGDMSEYGVKLFMITEATLVLAITKARALLKEAELALNKIENHGYCDGRGELTSTYELASKIRIELDNFIEPEGEK